MVAQQKRHTRLIMCKITVYLISSMMLIYNQPYTNTVVISKVLYFPDCSTNERNCHIYIKKNIPFSTATKIVSF